MGCSCSASLDLKIFIIFKRRHLFLLFYEPSGWAIWNQLHTPDKHKKKKKKKQSLPKERTLD